MPDRRPSAPPSKVKPRKQVAALPVRAGEDGQWHVMLMTSRETRRLIIPKGWPMPGRKDWQAAAIEARQEAGVIGRMHRRTIGQYLYWKHLPDRCDLCRVKVFLLEVERQLPVWRERLQRDCAWFLPDEAIRSVGEPALVGILETLPQHLPKKRRVSWSDTGGPRHEV